MGERLEEVDLNEVLEKNPAAYEVLKSIYSVYACDKRLPLIIGELNSKEKIPEEFIDGRIIIARTKNGDYSFLLFNPEIRSKFGIKYIKCSDIYPDLCDLITWEKDEKKKKKSPQIALRHMDNSDRLLDKIAALDDTTRMKQIKEKVWRETVKVAKGAKYVGQNALIPATKKAGRGVKKGLQKTVEFLDIIGQ